MYKDFSVLKKDDRSYLVSEEIRNLGAINGFSRRTGGFSHGKIQGLNFGYRVGDNADDVLENYKILADDLGFDIKKGVCARQQHTDNIRIVTKKDFGKGIFEIESDIEDTDGLITNEEGIALIVFTADCVPLLFFDPVKKVIAASHAGWRGTVKEIGRKTVHMMSEHFGSERSDIIIAIGPSIGKCCFEVDQETAMQFNKKYRIEKPNNKYHIDLWTVNKDALVSAGVLAENIFVSNQCTICNSDKYYSFRTHKEHTGRQVAVIALP